MRDQGETTLARRVVSFGAVPFLSLIAPLVILPVVAGATTSGGWAALAIGQSVGGLAAIVVGYGWQLSGPVEVARATRKQVREIYFESLVNRALVLVVVAGPVTWVCAAVAPPGYRLLATCAALATATAGLAFTWVSIGLGKPRSMLLYEVLPRLALSVSAAVAILNGGSVYLYPLSIAAGVLSGVSLFSVLVVRPKRPARVVRRMQERLRGHLTAAVTTMAGSAYSTGCLLLVGVATTIHQTAVMSSADRLYRIGLLAVMALASAFQGWVVSDDRKMARQRRHQALLAHICLGVLGFVGLATLAPSVAAWLFGHDLAPSHGVTAGYGLAFVAVAISSSLAQHFLVPAGRFRAALLGTVAGAMVGVPAILLLGSRYGAEGAAAGLMVGEAVVALIFGLCMWNRSKGPRASLRGADAANPSHRIGDHAVCRPREGRADQRQHAGPRSGQGHRHGDGAPGAR